MREDVSKAIRKNKELLQKGLPFIQEIGQKIENGEELSEAEVDAFLAAEKLVEQIKELEK